MKTTRTAAGILVAIALALLFPCAVAFAEPIVPANVLVSPLTATKVASVTATASTYSAGATQVVYSVKFKAEHALAASSGYVRLTAPAGAKFYALNGYGYEVSNEHESSQSDKVEVDPEVLGPNVVDVYIPGFFSVAAGETVTVDAYGSKNPAAAVPGGTFSVATSADTEAVSLPFVIGPPSAVSALNIALNTSSAGAGSVVYTASFKSTTALSDGNPAQFGDEERPGFIRLTAPSGTVFSSDGYSYEVTDGNESRQAVHVEVEPEGLAKNVVDVNVPGGLSISAGDTVTVAAYGATNPQSPDPSGEASLSSSSDIDTVTQSLPIGAKTKLGEAQASASVALAGATQVLYTASFKAAAAVSSGDAAQFGDEEKPGYIRLVAPAGTVFNSDGDSYELRVSNEPEPEQALHVVVDPEKTGATNVVDVNVSPYFKVGVAAGATVTVQAYGTANPSSANPAGEITLSTSSDVEPLSLPLAIGPATAVQDATLGTLGARSTVAFVAPSSISNGDPAQFGDNEQPGYVKLSAAGATLPASAAEYHFSVTGVAGGTQESGVLHVEVHGEEARVQPLVSIEAGSRVQLSIASVTGTLNSALISTSSDTIPVNGGTSTVLAPLEGTVGFEGKPVAGASVQACKIPPSGCLTTSTNDQGEFGFAVPAIAGSSYTITANPPALTSRAGEGRLAPVTIQGAAGVSGISLVLPQAPGIAKGAALFTGSGEETSATADPFLSWASPYELKLDPSFFPKAKRILVTKVVLEGTSAASGEPEQQVVDVGGALGGLSTGLELGPGPLTIDMPSAYPLHGEVSTTVDYRILRGHKTPVTGIASTGVLDETYPSAGSPPSDPRAAYLLNYANPAGISLTAGRIVGADKQDFKVVALGEAGTTDTSTDCGSSAAALDRFEGASNPPAGTECGVAVRFTPPEDPRSTKIYYYAKLRVKTGRHGLSTIPISLIGCDARVAQAVGASCYEGPGALAPEIAVGASQIRKELEEEIQRLQDGEKCLIVEASKLVEEPTQDCLGAAQAEAGEVVLEEEEEEGEEEEEEEEGEESGEAGGAYHDPSGVVYVNSAEGAFPLAGATVTLQRSFDEAGPFTTVPGGSTVMSPANRVNPYTTGADGSFGWDVLAGYYTVAAAKSGCATQETSVLSVPPPVLDLALTLTCTNPPARVSTSASVSSSASSSSFGQPVTFTAQVGGGSGPTGTVTFEDGSTTLGTGVLQAGQATLTLSTLAPGEHSITVAYGGDGANRPATSPALIQGVGTLGVSQEESKGGGSGGGGSTTTPHSEAPPPASGSVQLLGSSLVVAGGRYATVKLDCAGTAPCAGKLTLQVKTKRKGKKKAKLETIGSASFSIAAGRTVTVKLAFNGAGRALFGAEHGRLKATLTIRSLPSLAAQVKTIRLSQTKTRRAKKAH